MSGTLNQAERARGAILGVAVGDALGWPQEQNSKNINKDVAPELQFRSWRRRAGGRFQPFEEEIGAGEYSDDTQLTLCVARSLLHGADWHEAFTRCELPSWATYERGGGRSVLRAASSWATGRPPWVSDKGNPRDYFATGANGVAMRVLPHVLTGLDESFESVRARVVMDGCSTHGHTTALVGALIQASSLWFALNLKGTLGYGELLERVADSEHMWGERRDLTLPSGWAEARRQIRGPSFEEEWAQSVREARRLITIAQQAMESGPLADDEQTLEGLGVFDRKVNGSGSVTAVAALLIASRSASSPGLGLRQAAFLRSADTDTLASMTAAILGAIAGVEWMNGLQRQVQDREYLLQFADVSHARLPLAETGDHRPVTKSGLDRWTKSLADLSEGETTTLPNGRPAVLERSEPMQSRSARMQTVRHRLRTDDGETLFVVKHSRTAPPSSAGDQTRTMPVGVRIRVRRLEQLRLFYEEVLGLETSRAGETFVRYGDAFAFETAPAAAEQLRLANPPFVLQIESSDVEGLHRAVQSSGAEITERLREDKGRARFTCRDPEGNVVEVVAPSRQR